MIGPASRCLLQASASAAVPLAALTRLPASSIIVSAGPIEEMKLVPVARGLGRVHMGWILRSGRLRRTGRRLLNLVLLLRRYAVMISCLQTSCIQG